MLEGLDEAATSTKDVTICFHVDIVLHVVYAYLGMWEMPSPFGL